MRASVTAVFLILASFPCVAQPVQQPGRSADSVRPPTPANCTDVQVGSAQSYACINARLGAVAQDTSRFSSTDAPVTSSSPSNVVGTFNEGATRNRLGQNFGKSAIPYRPAPANPPALPPR